MDFSHHRLKNDEELLAYREKMGAGAFWNYLNRILKRISEMRPGEVFLIDKKVKEENRDLFIKSVCFFYENGYIQYTHFNDSFTEIRRYEEIKKKSKNNSNEKKEMDGGRKKDPI